MKLISLLEVILEAVLTRRSKCRTEDNFTWSRFRKRLSLTVDERSTAKGFWERSSGIKWVIYWITKWFHLIKGAHLCLGLPSGLFPASVPVKTHKAFVTSPFWLIPVLPQSSSHGDCNLWFRLRSLGTIHKLRHTNLMIFWPLPPCHRWSHFWDPVPHLIWRHIFCNFTPRNY